MTIHIGDRWGKRYEYFRYYVPFYIKYGIRFSDFRHHGEILQHPMMYSPDGFRPSPRDIVFDVGAQYGDFSLLWDKYFGANVFAFEPLKTNYEEMLRDLRLNHSIRTQPYNVLVGNGDPVPLEIHGNMITKHVRGQADATDAPTISIDGFVAEHGVIPDFIKIDVEGFEYEVLKGSETVLRKYSPKIIIETHSVELAFVCDVFLKRQGYNQSQVGRQARGNGWMDEVVNRFYCIDRETFR